MSGYEDQIFQNLQRMNTAIETEAGKCHRNPQEIKLIAVSKKQPMEKIYNALQSGHRHFGENRVQEAYEHWEENKKAYPDLCLHLIGPLQTNKVKQAVALLDVIHTLDREKLAKSLSKEMENQDRHLKCLIQVNTGEEPQKSGVLPQELSDFISFCKSECRINIEGLMCIPPIDEPPSLHFALLSKLARLHELNELSMGMSADYEKAIANNATYIRIGTGVFGERDYS